MLPVYQAFDRVQFADVATDGAEDLEGKLARASEIFAARDGWLKPHQRVAVLQDLAKRLDVERERFTRLIAREGGKPYTDAAIEVARAIALSQTTYQPTVLLEPPPTARVTCEEVFGPVTCVYRFAELDDALERANGLPLAFQASVFTNRLDVALRAAERLDAATVLINDHTAFRSDWMPFAGRKQSGYGIGGIPWTMHEMTHHKMLVFRR